MRWEYIPRQHFPTAKDGQIDRVTQKFYCTFCVPLSERNDRLIFFKFYRRFQETNRQRNQKANQMMYMLRKLIVCILMVKYIRNENLNQSYWLLSYLSRIWSNYSRIQIYRRCYILIFFLVPFSFWYFYPSKKSDKFIRPFTSVYSFWIDIYLCVCVCFLSNVFIFIEHRIFLWTDGNMSIDCLLGKWKLKWEVHLFTNVIIYWCKSGNSLKGLECKGIEFSMR